MIQVNRIYLIFNRLVTKKFLVDTSVYKDKNYRLTDFYPFGTLKCEILKSEVFLLNELVR